MNSGARCVVGLAVSILLLIAGIFLLKAGTYGWTIFVVFPVVAGGLSAWVFRPATWLRALGTGALTLTGAASCFLLLGQEGLLCVLMSLPLAVPLGALGSWLVYIAGSPRLRARSAAMLLLLPAASVTWDLKAPPPVYEVRTAIVVRATPVLVWRNVVTFSELPEPAEWFFRAGLAYPKRARIEGSGPGAVRYCEFSTGAFVEPIEVWDEPRLLRFRVTENPPPMREWNPYADVVPRHLHGYLVSKRGQFRLTQLADGQTLLEGTTWYQHGLWPAEYWRWWSDAIIHRIHLRVLNHIRILAERRQW